MNNESKKCNCINKPVRGERKICITTIVGEKIFESLRQFEYVYPKFKSHYVDKMHINGYDELKSIIEECNEIATNFSELTEKLCHKMQVKYNYHDTLKDRKPRNKQNHSVSKEVNPDCEDKPTE